MRSDIRTYKCVECFRRFKTHADLTEASRVCPVCRVLDYTPPPAPLREVAKPSRSALKRHKLSGLEYWRLLHREQGSVCGICRRVPWEYVIDHNHATGDVRGVLCHGCNTALGLFGDDPATLQRALDYLASKGNYAGRNIRATRAPSTEETA